MTVLEPSKGSPLPKRRRVYTTADLEEMPHDARYELIRGELYLMPNNSAEHGNKTALISAYVTIFVAQHNLGKCFAAETRFVIAENPDTTLAPDFAFISNSRQIVIPPTGYLRIAPDLIVETRSPSDRRREFALKIVQWISAGTQVVWAVEPATKTLTIHKPNTLPQTLAVNDTLTEEALLPGFSLPLTQIFTAS